MSNDVKELHPLILQLANADQRESALLELCRKREAFPDLTPILWQSCASTLLDPCPFSLDSTLVTELPNCRLTLDALLFLLKSRYNTNLHATVRRMVIRQTNTLYREGLGINLMKSVTNGLNHLRNPAQFMLMDSCLRKVSECLFFMYYGTQIEEFEVSSLIDVMKSTSDTLVNTVTPGIVEEWKTSAYSILAVLQMTHIAALDQFNSLLLRTNDDINTSEDGINTLKLPRESKGGLDVVWRSKGAKGLACLANAVLQQPAVDNNEAPASDVIWFLKEASENRAYSYIRLCVLPLLQCSYLGDDEHFYISVLCELLRKIAHIFHIYELARHPDKSQYLRSHDLALARSGTDRSRLIRADCLDDVMHLFAVVCSVRPSYADAFRDVDAAGASALHPFVVTSIEASDRQQCLALPSMRLLAGVASGLNGSSSSASYHFLKSGRHARLKWDHFFHCIEGFANKLGPVQPVNPLGMIAPSGSSIVSVRSAPLNPKDEEGLLAIIELIGACVQDSNIASNMYHKYDPVKKLFSLLACPIPISLKGSVFRTLAAFVKSSSTIAAEVWDLIELYRLLPSKGTTGVQQGLRFELEATESRAGVYSSTEGFLQLLDALLCTHETPDNLGMGYRRPGLTVYLEFVIDDVLLRAHERFYAPEGTHRGMTQRWRLTARALKVLVSIMQHYAINRLPLGPLSSLPFAVRDDQLLQGVAADFREEIVSYKIDDLPEQRCSRPKTLGFSLMALMLGRCRLLERVLSLLGECSLAALDAESALQGGETAKTSVEIFATMQDPKRIPAMTGGFNASSNEEERDLELDLSLMGFNEESFACDGSYWMEKTVSNCIGLLYECALREGRFLELILSAPPLTLLRSEDGRTAALPVMVQGGLVEALSSSLALGTIAHFLRLPAQRWHSIPSVPVMATRLLEHVSISQSSDRFMWAMRSSPEEEGYLLTGCVRAIIEGDETETSAVFKENFPLGADRYPDVFSLSSSTSGRAPDIKEMLKIAMTDNGGTLETARGALLRLMLRALLLTPDRLCLTHQLLGLRQAIEDGSNGNNLAALSQLQRPTLGYMPANCLQAILILISPSDPAYIDSTPSFIQREPELACICYEIIYRLCAAPLSSAVALGYLRLYDVQFLRTQMIELLHLAGLSDSNLRPSDEQIAESSSHSRIESIKAARHDCTAYVLQIFALEVRALEENPNSSPTKMRDLLSSFLDDPRAGSDVDSEGYSSLMGAYRGSNSGPKGTSVMIILSMAMELPVLSLPSINSPVILRCMSAATMPYSVSRGGQQSTTGFTTISISLLTKLLREEGNPGTVSGTSLGPQISAEFEGALKAAVQMNVYNMRAAAATHLCEAWGQAVNVSVLGYGGSVLSASNSDKERDGSWISLPRLISTVVLPTLHALSVVPLEMIMAEQLVKAVLSLLSTLRPSSDSQPCISQAESSLLLTALIRALLRRAGGSGVPRSSSALYRGFLYSCLTRVLNYSLSSANGSTDNQQNGSEEGKGYEMRGYGYSDDTMTLEQCSAELADTLGADACSGPPVWRVVAISALSSVLTYLGPFRNQEHARVRDSKHYRGEDDIYGFSSSSYIQALQALSVRGHLSAIMACVGTSDISADPNLNEPGSQELFECAASLCVSLAGTREGGLLLLDNGFIARVCALPFFRTPPPSVEEISPFGSNGVALRDEALRLMDARLIPVLRVLRCLCAVSPFQPVIEGTARFLQLNHLLVSYLLRLRVHTLKGLSLVEGVLALMSLVASSATENSLKQARYTTESAPTSAVGDRAVWGMLGSLGDAFVADTCSLMRILGREPVPHPASSRSGWGLKKGAGDGWWEHFVPSTAQEFSLHEQQVFSGGHDDVRRTNAGLVTPPNWTLFDQKKLKLSLQVTSLAAAFLRRISSASEKPSHLNEGIVDGGLLSIDFESISVAFMACASLCCQKDMPSSSSSSSVQWLINQSATAILETDLSGDRAGASHGINDAVPSLLYIAENLICVLHNMNAAASAAEKSCWALHLDRCVVLTERDFPAHSFVKQVGRWIRDQMNHEMS